MSLTRVVQWAAIAGVILVLVGLNYEFESKAGMQMNAPSESPLSQSLHGYWKLDDGSGTNATDSSGNGNTLSMTGSPSWVTGNIGPFALDFSGTGQYLSIASPSSVLDFADGASFTLTGWFNRDTFASDHTILSTKSGQSTESDGYIAYIDDATDQLIIRFDENGSTDARTFTSTSTFTATGWHQFALSWNESAPDAILYIDGKPDGSGSGTAFASMGNLSNTNAFYIGAETDAGNPFDGKLDDIRIYGYALSADQVKKLYNTTSPTQPVDTSLVGHWTFDGTDIQGTTAIDRSSYGNNGTITGTTKTIGKLGQALSFNGSSSDVDMGDPVSGVFDFDTGQAFSVSFWIKAPVDNTIISKSFADTSQGYFIGYDNASSSFQLKLRDASTACSWGFSSPLAAGTWYNVTWVVSGSRQSTVYLNSLVSDSNDCSSVGDLSNSDSLSFGYLYVGTSTYMSGTLDDVRIYNRALSSTEVLNLYNLGR